MRIENIRKTINKMPNGNYFVRVEDLNAPEGVKGELGYMLYVNNRSETKKEANILAAHYEQCIIKNLGH